MRFHSRDLMVTVDPEVHLMPGGPAPTGCVCTQTAPPCPFPSLGGLDLMPAPPGPCGCTATAPVPGCPFPSLADLVTDKAGRLNPGALETLRSQLRAELRTS